MNKLTSAQITTLILTHVTGAQYGCSLKVKSSTEVLTLTDLSQAGDSFYTVKPEFFELAEVKKHRMFKAYNWLTENGFVFDGSRWMCNRVNKSFIKMYNPQTEKTAWFDRDGSVYIQTTSAYADTLVMSRGKLAE